MQSGIVTLIIVTGSMLALFVIITTIGNNYSLNQIKNKTVGQGQHGTARWATKKEIKRTYKQIDFQPNEWRNNPESRPTEQEAPHTSFVCNRIYSYFSIFTGSNNKPISINPLSIFSLCVPPCFIYVRNRTSGKE